MTKRPASSPQDQQAMPDGCRSVPRRVHFDTRLGSLVVSVGEGEFYVSTSPYEVLATVLGSCIAVCIRDPIARCGGMNHFLLPRFDEKAEGLPTAALRYGSYSTERLVNALIGRGGRRDRLEVKVFGGANIAGQLFDHGHANSDFVLNYLKRERLRVVAQSLYGHAARRVRYHVATGSALIKELPHDKSQLVAGHELNIVTKFPVAPARKSVEFF